MISDKKLTGSSASGSALFAKPFTGKALTKIAPKSKVALTTRGEIVAENPEISDAASLSRFDKDSLYSNETLTTFKRNLFNSMFEHFDYYGGYESFSSALGSTQSLQNNYGVEMTTSNITVDGNKFSADFSLSGSLAGVTNKVYNLEYDFGKSIKTVVRNNSYSKYSGLNKSQIYVDGNGTVTSRHVRIVLVNLLVTFDDEPSTTYLKTIAFAVNAVASTGNELYSTVYDHMDFPLIKSSLVNYRTINTGNYAQQRIIDEQWSAETGGQNYHLYIFKAQLPNGYTGLYGFCDKDMKFTYHNMPKLNGNKWEFHVFTQNQQLKVTEWPKLSECWYTDMTATGENYYRDSSFNIYISKTEDAAFLRAINASNRQGVIAFSKTGAFAPQSLDSNTGAAIANCVQKLGNGYLACYDYNNRMGYFDLSDHQFKVARTPEIVEAGAATSTRYTHDAGNDEFSVSFTIPQGTFSFKLDSSDIVGTPEAQSTNNTNSSNNNSVLFLGLNGNNDDVHAFQLSGNTYRFYGILSATTDDADKPRNSIYFYVDIDTTNAGASYTAINLVTIKAKSTSSIQYKKIYVFGQDCATFYNPSCISDTAISTSLAGGIFDGNQKPDDTVSYYNGGHAVISSPASGVKVELQGGSITLRFNANENYVKHQKLGGYATFIATNSDYQNPFSDELFDRFAYPNSNFYYKETSDGSSLDWGVDAYNANLDKSTTQHTLQGENWLQTRTVVLSQHLRNTNLSPSQVALPSSTIADGGHWYSSTSTIISYYSMYFIGEDHEGNLWFSRCAVIYGTSLLMRINPSTFKMDFLFFDSPYNPNADSFVKFTDYGRYRFPYTTYSSTRYKYTLLDSGCRLGGLMSHQYKVMGDRIYFAGSDSTTAEDYELGHANNDISKHNVLWSYPIGKITEAFDLGKGYKNKILQLAEAKKLFVSEHIEARKLGAQTNNDYALMSTNVLDAFISQDESVGITGLVGTSPLTKSYEIGDDATITLDVAPFDVSDIDDKASTGFYEIDDGLGYYFISDPLVETAPTSEVRNVTRVVASGITTISGTVTSKNYIHEEITIPECAVDEGRAWIEAEPMNMFGSNFEGVNAEITSPTKIKLTAFNLSGVTYNGHFMRVSWKVLESK